MEIEVLEAQLSYSRTDIKTLYVHLILSSSSISSHNHFTLQLSNTSSITFSLCKMKFSAQIAVACLSAGALAHVAPRALSDFQSVLTTVQTDVDGLDAAINAFNGATGPVQTAATTLVNDINTGNGQLSGQPVLSLADTLTLNTQVTSFKNHAQTLVTDIKNKRSVVISTGNCALVRNNIDAINSSAGTLIATIVSKTDPLAKSIAEKQAKDIQAILDDGKAYYTTANCP